jgi:hypothetical protein
MPYSYNPDLLENWTSAQLKDSLKSCGISFPANARRALLIRLYTDSVLSARSLNAAVQLSDPSINAQRSHSAMDQNNNGVDCQNNALVDIVSKLTSTVQSLQQNVINLTARVNSMTQGACIQMNANAGIAQS